MGKLLRCDVCKAISPDAADSVDPLVVRLGEVTAELERANALLREWLSGKWCTPEYNDARQRAYNHLSEPRT